MNSAKSANTLRTNINGKTAKAKIALGVNALGAIVS
jgi:hypothetical protein